jgi:hypothetical protein
MESIAVLGRKKKEEGRRDGGGGRDGEGGRGEKRGEEEGEDVRSGREEDRRCILRERTSKVGR